MSALPPGASGNSSISPDRIMGKRQEKALRHITGIAAIKEETYCLMKDEALGIGTPIYGV